MVAWKRCGFACFLITAIFFGSCWHTEMLFRLLHSYVKWASTASLNPNLTEHGIMQTIPVKMISILCINTALSTVNHKFNYAFWKMQLFFYLLSILLNKTSTSMWQVCLCVIRTGSALLLVTLDEDPRGLIPRRIFNYWLANEFAFLVLKIFKLIWSIQILLSPLSPRRSSC